MIWDHKTKGTSVPFSVEKVKDKKLRTEYKREEKCLPWPSDFITQKKAVRSGKSLQSTVKLQVKANTKRALAGVHQGGISTLALLGLCTAAQQPALLHKHCSSLILASFHLQIPSA